MWPVKPIAERYIPPPYKTPRVCNSFTIAFWASPYRFTWTDILVGIRTKRIGQLRISTGHYPLLGAMNILISAIEGISDTRIEPSDSMQIYTLRQT